MVVVATGNVWFGPVTVVRVYRPALFRTFELPAATWVPRGAAYGSTAVAVCALVLPDPFT